MVYRLQASDRKRRNDKTRRLLKAFETAVMDVAFIGSARADEHEQINSNYKSARKKLLEHVDG